jgi:hypothetical protein
MEQSKNTSTDQQVRIPAMAGRHSGSSRSSIPDDARLGVTR